MSGHSKWATTHRAKEIVDAKRGAAFTKIANVITIAARKGGDPASNFSLRIAIDRGKAANMPKENIERAIKRGTGELTGATIEELTYEAVGPANSQFVIKILTDNKNRTAAEVRHLLASHGGAMGATLWNFDLKGVIRVAKAEAEAKGITRDEGQLELIDAGADDVKIEAEGLTILTTGANLQKVKTYLEGKGVATESAEIEYVAKDTIEVTGEDATKIDGLIAALDENEDVADYYSNLK
ncbi:MAG TPA: YebC/PmpR family DNA-binding transcriptional regulator [Candidatus Methylomirabilis sp.]|nr:YebC/PmpR family DNA-binding transcriptional regulator [Candidatus Methylomirabilis sp.]